MKLYIRRQGNAPRLSRETEELLRNAVKLSLLRMKADPLSETGLVLTDDPGIQKLNDRYRGKDSPTDVLSFHTGTSGFLGDVVVSVDRAAEQAYTYGHSFEREMAFLTVHGMLHLLGLDHENEEERVHMEKLQRQILLALSIPGDRRWKR